MVVALVVVLSVVLVVVSLRILLLHVAGRDGEAFPHHPPKASVTLLAAIARP